MKLYPTKFECVNEDLPIFKIEAFDECSAKVSMAHITNAAEWLEVSAKVLEALKAMELEVDL